MYLDSQTLYVARLLSGSTVAVGAPLAQLQAGQVDKSSPTAPAGTTAAAPAPAPAAPAAAAAAATSPAIETVINVPGMGDSITSGTITKWEKSEFLCQLLRSHAFLSTCNPCCV